MPEMKLALANARYDTAAWPWLYGPSILDAIFAIGAGDKIMYGSDWPILNFSRFEKLLAGTRLSDAKGRHHALVKADGNLTVDGFTGSIHRVGAHVQGAAACNGWTFWHVSRAGKLCPIDDIRGEIRRAAAA